jgi:hypothetical protein
MRIAIFFLVSFVLVSTAILVPVEVGYAAPTPPGVQLAVTSMSKISGPSYTVFQVTSALPSSSVTFTVSPFAPGDSVGISYTVENEGKTTATLSTPGVKISPSGTGFTASIGSIPTKLAPGKSFTSSITVTFQKGLGNNYEKSTATITLVIYGSKPPPSPNYSVSCTPAVVGQASTCTATDQDGNGILVIWSANASGTFYPTTTYKQFPAGDGQCIFTQKQPPSSCSVSFTPGQAGDINITATNYVIGKNGKLSLDGSDVSSDWVILYVPP